MIRQSPRGRGYFGSNGRARSLIPALSSTLATEEVSCMEEMVLLKPKLTRLKMSGVLETLRRQTGAGDEGEMALLAVP